MIRSTRSGQYGATAGLDRGEPRGPRRDVVLVDAARPGSRGAAARWPAPGRCPGSGCRCSVGAGGGRGAPRVDDDVRGPVGPAGVEVLHGRRHGVGRVGADQQDRLGLGDVGQRERQPAVDAEGPVAGGGRRRHAEPAVVVDHRGAQRDPGELAERVRLLVGQPAAAEAADRVAARTRCWAARMPVDDQRRAPRPRRPAATGWSGRRGRVRTSGVSSRCGWSSRSAAVQPLEHSPPRLVGKSCCGCSVAGRSPATIEIPHCSEQYGQCVRVGVELTAPSSAHRCYDDVPRVTDGSPFPHIGLRL